MCLEHLKIDCEVEMVFDTLWIGGMVSVLVVVPARELTDLGTEPYLETLTLILWPKSAVFLGGMQLSA